MTTFNLRDDDSGYQFLTALFQLRWVEKQEGEMTFHIGQRFYHDQDVYILAQVMPLRVALINLQTGNRWSDPVAVQNVQAITSEELEYIMAGNITSFSLIFKGVEE